MNTPFPVAIGCDEAGFELKELLKRHIETLGYPVTDFGTHSTAPVLYPDIALAVAHAVQCPYCIDAYTTQCLETGSNPEQMMEAVHAHKRVSKAQALEQCNDHQRGGEDDQQVGEHKETPVRVRMTQA